MQYNNVHSGRSLTKPWILGSIQSCLEFYNGAKKYYKWIQEDWNLST